MLDDRLLYPPLTYDPLLMRAGLALVLLAVVVPLAVVLVTSGMRLPRLVRRSTLLRRWGLRRVDRVVAAHAAGRIDGPTAASELSQAVRRFAGDWTGTLFGAMTLSTLREVGEPRLEPTVEHLYRDAFTPGEADVAAAADRAREVIRTWSRT